jgi:hypothetical protein
MTFWNGYEWVADTPPTTAAKPEGRVKHVAKAVLEAGLITALTFGLIAGSAFAAKPSARGGGTGSYSASLSPSGPYTFGQEIFVTTNAPVYPNNTGPWVDVSCTQSGTKVYDVTHAGFDGGWYYNWSFTLGPTYMWTGGAADCKVWVYHQSHNKFVTDATSYFQVDG